MAFDVRPFAVAASQDALDDLRARLARTRLSDEVEGAAWAFGTDRHYLEELVTYWQTTFDWRRQEALLNTFTHLRADVEGFGLHAIHERGKGPDPLPIVLTNGWPSTFFELLVEDIRAFFRPLRR